MRHYEIVAVIHPDQQGRIAAMIDLYKKIVTDGGGVLHRLEDWGRRPLAYPIQNQNKAQYVLMNIECGNDTLAKLRESFRFSDSIIRSLVVRRDKAITETSVILKKQEAEEAERQAEKLKAKQAAAAAEAVAKSASKAPAPAESADKPASEPAPESAPPAAEAAPAADTVSKTDAAAPAESAPAASSDSNNEKETDK